MHSLERLPLKLGSLFVWPYYLQSETKIEPDLRLAHIWLNRFLCRGGLTDKFYSLSRERRCFIFLFVLFKNAQHRQERENWQSINLPRFIVRLYFVSLGLAKEGV